MDMSKVSYTQVGDVDASAAFSGNLIDNDLSATLEDTTDSLEHVYIVFDASVSIDDGVLAIEQKVLNGENLDVVRYDESANAVVAVVTSAARKEIQKLSEVSYVKVNEAAITLDKSDALTTANGEADSFSDGAKEAASTNESSIYVNESTSATTGSDLADEEAPLSDEDDQVNEQTDSAINEETELFFENSDSSTAESSSETGTDSYSTQSHAVAYSVVGILIILAAIAAIFFRKKG